MKYVKLARDGVNNIIKEYKTSDLTHTHEIDGRVKLAYFL